MCLRLLFVEIAFDRVENSVNKLRGFVGREAASYFECFVYGDSARCRFVKEFVNCQPQNISIDNGHSRDAPMFSPRANTLIKRFQVRKRAGGPREVDDRVRLRQRSLDVGADQHAAGRAGELGGVLADERMAGLFEGRGERRAGQAGGGAGRRGARREEVKPRA